MCEMCDWRHERFKSPEWSYLNEHYEDCSCDDCHDTHKDAAAWAPVCRRCKEQAQYEAYMEKYHDSRRDFPIQPEEFRRLRDEGKLEG